MTLLTYMQKMGENYIYLLILLMFNVLGCYLFVFKVSDPTPKLLGLGQGTVVLFWLSSHPNRCTFCLIFRVHVHGQCEGLQSAKYVQYKVFSCPMLGLLMTPKFVTFSGGKCLNSFVPYYRTMAEKKG